ncbi:MAG: signal peptidase I [Tannerellaceae bacterium]|nr:signal peptidase I [Tannerellaceae bacterium]
MKYNLQELSQKVINGLFWICICIVCIACIRLFFFSSFRIPTNSMEPEIISGDHVLVGKLVPGARLFNIFASSKGEQVQIYRLPGIRKTKRNDVMVFNIPYPLGSEQIEMDITQYYIKRCIGLPGDTVRIINGIYTVSGYPESVGDLQA